MRVKAGEGGRESLRTIYSPTGDDGGADGVGPSVWRASLLWIAGERLAGCRLSGDSGARELSGRHARDDGKQCGHAARTAVHADSRVGTGDFQQQPGAHEFRAAVCAFEEPRRGGDRRASRDHEATGQLPVDLPSPPTFTKTNPNDQPIIYVALTSDTVTAGQLYDYANTQVGERISILPGVSQVAVYGTQSAVRIKADPSAMAIRNITIDDLNTAIKNGTSYTGAGQFDGQHRTFLLQPQGQLSTAEQYEQLIVGQSNGAPVYLKDVAIAKDTVQDERIDMRFWVRGHHVPTATVVIAVFRQAGSNAVEVAKAVRDLLPSVQAQLPGSVAIVPIYDRSQTIVDSMKDVQETLYIAFALVVLVIFLFLGRATDTLIPAVALPLSLLLTFVAMNVLGYSLDNLSLMALTLAIGFLVDDAIVFLENTVRLMEDHGQNALRASLESAKEISFTILAMTISLAAVFIPLVFMSGLMGRIFREFSITIIVSIFASGIVSLTLTPLMCSRLLRERGAGAKKTWMERVVGGDRAPGARLVRALAVVFSAAPVDLGAYCGWSAWWEPVYLFYRRSQSFLPVGDSSFIRGVFVAQEGSSPESDARLSGPRSRKGAARQSRGGHDLHHERQHDQFLPANQGFVLAFLKDPDKRPPIRVVARAIDGGLNSSSPGTMTFLQPNPVLQISTGATANFAGAIRLRDFPGSTPTRFTPRRVKLMAKMFTISRISVRQLRSLQSHAERAGETSCAIRPSSMASRRRGSSRCCTTPIRRTTAT